jgi:hypothetical protein
MSNKRHVAEALSAAMKAKLQRVVQNDPHGDTRLLQVNPHEASILVPLLKRMGGANKPNPRIGRNVHQFYEDAGGSGRAGPVGQGGHNDMGGSNRGGNGGEGNGRGGNGAPTGGYAGTRNPNGSLANGANTNAASNHTSNSTGGNKTTAGNENAAQGESIARGSAADINGYGDSARVNSSLGKAGPVLSGDDFNSWTSAPAVPDAPTINKMKPGTYDSSIDNPANNEQLGYASGHPPSEMQNLAREVLGWAGIGYSPNASSSLNPDGTTSVSSRVSVDPLGVALTAGSFFSPIIGALSLGYKGWNELTGVHAPNVGFNIGGGSSIDTTGGSALGNFGNSGLGADGDSHQTSSLIRKLVVPTVVEAPTGTVYNSAGTIRKPGAITNYINNALAQ